ncbi:uncharacterized protein LOC116341855 isoform X2 [Contarinia nasturtii]|uniref:uncharacterized protein LOC116341855 isoform X2 n=1 Tax=Contarinia nasturtii TaxID=265458 RepID=UPI0012D42276|nr:uncharacterized protein LOC116341855 isoform X2 [Contarinia nasturtii]
MKNLLIVATSALCVLLAVAVPLPEQDVQIVQIPLEGDKELDILSLPENEGQLTDRNKRTIGVLRQLFPELSKMTSNANGDVDLAALSERLDSFNRVVRNTASQQKDQPIAESKSDKGDVPNAIATAIEKEDSSPAASDKSESKSPALDELSLDDEENGTKDDDRNKRFLSFGFGGSGSNGSGGSGNFLFDIIRRTADRAARAAGTIYRVAAGTESFDLDNNKQATRSTGDDTDFDHNNNDDNDSTSRKLSAGNDNGLVGGSAGTEQTDERENAPEGEATIAKNADGYTEGIPGPVTRLFVLANRGLANLIQDLILRIAQTSERVVNFKARLITSLI